MFRFIEGLQEKPVKFLAYPNTKFKSGSIGQIYYIDDTPVIGLSDGGNPFGIVKNNLESTDLYKEFVEIYYDRMVFQTDLFDFTCNYKTGTLLYSNEYGVLSAEKPHIDSLAFARIISVREDYKECLLL